MHIEVTCRKPQATATIFVKCITIMGEESRLILEQIIEPIEFHGHIDVPNLNAIRNIYLLRGEIQDGLYAC